MSHTHVVHTLAKQARRASLFSLLVLSGCLGDAAVSEDGTSPVISSSETDLTSTQQFLSEGPVLAANSGTNAVLYKHSSYSGESWTFGRGIYGLDSFDNDAVSSLKVPLGWKVKLYERARSGGRTKSFTSDTPYVGNDFNDITSTAAIIRPVVEPTPPSNGYSLQGFTDAEGLKYKVATDARLTKYMALFADMLGFAWCGGTRSPYVGEDFDVSRRSDGSYLLKAHYNSADPYADGYRANERLEITLSNFRIQIDPASFSYGTPLATSVVPITLSQAYATNRSDTPSALSVALTDEHSESIVHTTHVSFTEGINVSIAAEAKVPLLGGSTVTTGFSFESTQGWSDSRTETDVQGVTVNYTATVPPMSRKLIRMIGLRTESNVAYTATARILFDVQFKGFLRWGGNALNSHPENRPTKTVTFGGNGRSGFEEIIDMYDHAYIPNYSEWDWDWVKAYSANVGPVMSLFRGGVSVPLSGSFSGVKGLFVDIEEGAAESLGAGFAEGSEGSIAESL